MMRLSRAVRRAIPVAAALATVVAFAASGEIPAGERRSGFDFMSRETQGMQRDDTLNPGMLWVAEGEALWRRRDGAAGRACADCHGEASASMRGIAARYPAFDARERRPVDLQGRVNLCRVRHQEAPPLAFEGQELLALVAYVARQSRDVAIEPDDDERLAPFRERGRQFFTRQIGQLNFSCAQCHDDRWGERLGGSVIPQAHPTGYPIYRLEWQGLGSLQRRLRNCMTGVRAEPFAFGAEEYVDLELFLMARARGLAVETPAIRP